MRNRIGLMVPSTNTTCEADYQMVASKSLSVHGQRLWLTNDSKGEAGMERMNSEIESSARYLATARVNAIVYACTTGSFFKGVGWDREMVNLIEKTANVSAIATSPAVVDALRFLGARKISVATPYPDWNNRRLRTYMENAGFTVLNVEGDPTAALAGQQGINDQSPESVVRFAAQICSAEADILFCSCTAWRAMEVIEVLEQKTGLPVVTSNQATVWATFRKIGLNEPVKGFGQLLRSLGR